MMRYVHSPPALLHFLKWDCAPSAASAIRPVRLLVIVAAALCGALETTPALATCGDYLLHSSGVHSTRGEPMPPGVFDDAADSFPAPQPCSGPHCRSERRVPVAPAVPLEWEATPERALLAAAGRLSPVADRFFAGRDAGRLLAGYPLLVERPPRTV